MKLSGAQLKIILDSRGKETLEAELKSGEFFASASVPSGKSTGSHEAFVLEPKLAVEKFNEIKPQILSREFESQQEFDNFLIQLDNTPNKKNLGANLILALSLAFARLKAKDEKKELFEYIKSISQLPNYPITQLPRPIFNVINGGAHENIRINQQNPHKSAFLNFQEFQIIPEVKDFGMALGLGQEFYEKLKNFLEKKFGKENVLLGDEAGFSCPFENNEEAIEVVADLIAKNNYPLRIGLDAAASQFYQKDGYYLVNCKKLSATELKGLYLKLIEAYNILSIEDPFNEESFDDFAELTRNNSETLIIADDLTTTNPQRLQTAIDKKAGNAILVKLNQIGTLTETLEVINLAYQNNWQAIVSHRSGETMDNFIADLAVGVNAWGLKAGAPAAPERLIKYERVLEIRNHQS